MNAQPDVTTMAATRTLVFEPTSAGGGSFWQGDNLLATLTILRHPERQGRLSLRDPNRTLVMVRHTQKQRTSYQLFEGLRQIADAEWSVGETYARLHYQGREYSATPQDLVELDRNPPVAILSIPHDWNAEQMELRLDNDADLPLVAFYLFMAYDLANSSAGP